MIKGGYNMNIKNKYIKCIKTNRLTGIKKGVYYLVIDSEYDNFSLKILVNKEKIWFRSYYFDLNDIKNKL